MVKGKKILAMLLIFTMTISYLGIVTEAIAATDFVSIFGVSSDTQNEKIEFEANLTNGEETSASIISDVNNPNVALNLKLDVKESGYLKEAKVEIKTEDDEELNFEIKEDNEIAQNDNVQKLENNVVEFNKIDSSSDVIELSIPIKYKMEEYISENKLANNAKAILSGIYVDKEGEENEISKESELNLAWTDSREVSVESEVSKYVQFGDDGVVLQTVVKVDSSNPDKNSLPAKQTELNIDVPELGGVKPSQVTVVANSTMGTNGKSVGEVEFGADNWTYNEDESKINIKIENRKQLVDVNKDEYLKEEGKEVKNEERYYSAAGVDEFLVTYVFEGVQISEEMKVSAKTEAKLTKFSGVSEDDMNSVVTAENAGEFTITEQTGNIISYNIENETKEASKIYGYLNNEKEYNSKTSINISYKDIAEEIYVEDVANYYIDKTGNRIEADDIYYKEISVSKENFSEILGEDGAIKILDLAGNVVATIDNDSTANENGNYIVDFQNKMSKVAIKTSAPVNTGNLIISSKKMVSNISVEKAVYSNIDSLVTDTVQKAKLAYMPELLELGNCTVSTKLVDTVTDFNLIVDRENLSTVTTNSNVEIRLELNNDKETSDIYGATVFEIEMPEYITALNISNASVIYGEGLDVSNVETYIRNGKVIIKVTVSGEQKNLNSGVLTNGTNIVLNADVTVDNYTPSLDTSIKAYCYNSQATNYSNAVEYALENTTVCGSEEVKIEYTAPSGVIAVNTLSNYNEAGKSVTSIKQGEQVDYIDIYSEAKNATMEVVVINNNDNSVSNLAILGKIPFEGVKDLSTGEDLGTTIDTKMVSGIASNPSNIGDFTIYYSENKEATHDLSDENNNWVSNPESLENMKSYLIVPADENYEIQAKQVLRFSYEYQIPENLNHNENIFGTFLVYYTNNTETEKIDETVKPDLVGLTTGAGPELEMQVKYSKAEVKANDKLDMKITVKSTGEDAVNDVKINIPVPEKTRFVSATVNKDTASAVLENNSIVAVIPRLEKDEEVDITLELKVKEISKHESEEINVEIESTAKDLGKPLKIVDSSVKIKRSELTINQVMEYEIEDYTFEKGAKLKFALYAKNLTDSEKQNVKVETQLPKELKFSEAYMIGGTPETGIEKLQIAKYDSTTNKVTFEIGKLEANKGKSLKLILEVGDLDSGITEKATTIETKILADNTDIYKAEELSVKIGRASISVVQTSTSPTYIKEGDIIDYKFTIKNESSIPATDILLTDIVPDGLIIREVSYDAVFGKHSNNMSETEKAQMTLTLGANEQVEVNVKAVASSLNGTKEKTVTNLGTVSNEKIGIIESNSVTHIIQAKEQVENSEGTSTNNGPTATDTIKPENSGNTDNTSNNANNNNNGDITKSYKITGTAWLDSNKNGMRDEHENRMENITAMLVDSSTGVIKSTVSTKSNGEYSFAGIQNGSYLVLFKYDTAYYMTTNYKQEGIDSSVNSDVVTTKIEQDGRKEYGAVTDIININGASVSNIDIGLVEAEQFSLSLDKAITKVTVQNAEGTVTEQFDKTKLAQYGITAKYLIGTTVYVEYTLTVNNNGDLAGFASEIVDYIPQGMTFNSNLNPDWYTGNDGSLYTKALADTELVPGESREIKLVLTKKLTTSNTEIVSNSAEIADDFNIYGVSDRTSRPSNKAQGEDDISTADIILTVKTGESLIYVSAIIVSTMIGCVVAFIIYERVIKTKRKGGV